MTRGGGPALIAALLAAGVLARFDQFDHARHEEVFPSCTTCHAGVLSGTSPWPEASSCRSCHDGVIQKETEWRPPVESPRSNLRFGHVRHAEVLTREDTTARCVDCHADLGAPWMAVRRTAIDRCLDCHQVATEHLAAPAAACATCHLSLAQASRLTTEDIAAFDEPPSHREEDFTTAAGHGAAATAVPGAAVAPSCATCHARDFCLICHVDAPEQPAVQALARDPRSLALTATLAAPSTHARSDFLATHGAAARQAPGDCATCHTQESCLSCHQAVPATVALLPAAARERGTGARVARHAPDTHRDNYTEAHGPTAAAVPQTCAGCHVQADCLECHRPGAGTTGSYHGTTFLARHPAAAFARETDCASCHNPGVFCATCHSQAGLAARGPLGSGYHDAKRFFIFGHGQAARQSLETCVSCHVERDCLSCHSSQGGRRFNPHGPGFDAERLRQRNPGMCTVCHGARIPQP